MIFKWAEMELDYLNIMCRNDVWDYEWLQKQKKISILEFEVLIESVSIISSQTRKCKSLMIIYVQLINQNNIDFAGTIQKAALDCAKSIIDISDKIEALLERSREREACGNTR